MEKEATIPTGNKEVTLVDRAEIVASRIEEANKKAEELLKKNEEIAARLTLGGRSTAGTPQEIKKETTPKDYVKEVLAGKHNEQPIQKK